MRYTASTVNVVTTDGQAGRAGVTVSAMSSVSAEGDTPTLLICVHHLSPACHAIIENTVFCVNILSQNQSYIADTFAGRIPAPNNDKFACAEWLIGTTNTPIVRDSLVSFECRLIENRRVGTHHVFIGGVVETRLHSGNLPLIYSNRAYGLPSRLDKEVGHTLEGQEERLFRVGTFLTIGPYYLPELTAKFLRCEPSSRITLVEGNQGQILESLRTDTCDLLLTYDMQIDSGMETIPLTQLEPYVLLASTHPLAARKSVALAELQNCPFILYDIAPSQQYFLKLFEMKGLKPRIKIRSSSFETVRGMVGEDLGFSLLATRPTNERSYSGRSLVALNLDDCLPASNLVIVIRKDKPRTRLTDRFIAICLEHFTDPDRQEGEA